MSPFYSQPPAWKAGPQEDCNAPRVGGWGGGSEGRGRRSSKELQSPLPPETPLHTEEPTAAPRSTWLDPGLATSRGCCTQEERPSLAPLALKMLPG